MTYASDEHPSAPLLRRLDRLGILFPAAREAASAMRAQAAEIDTLHQKANRLSDALAVSNSAIEHADKALKGMLAKRTERPNATVSALLRDVETLRSTLAVFLRS